MAPPERADGARPRPCVGVDAGLTDDVSLRRRKRRELEDQVEHLTNVMPIGLTPNAPMDSVVRWADPISPSP